MDCASFIAIAFMALMCLWSCTVDYTIDNPQVSVKQVSLCVIVDYGQDASEVLVCPDGGVSDSGK